MNCFGCSKKLDPILTFARPHGRYSKCEECRAKMRRLLHASKREKAEAWLAEGRQLDPYWARFVGHVCSRSC